MASKIKVKLILELRAAQVSQREICRTRKMSQHSVGEVYKIANQLEITYDDIKDKSEEEVYQLFFPDKHTIETLFTLPDYTYVHKELKRTGVNLKLLWNEYKDNCFQTNTISVGYTKFCEGYSDYVMKNSLTNHLIHKPGIICEVDWSGSTMSIVNKETGEIIPVYLFVATLPYSQYSYVEPCFDMKQNTWLKCHVNMFNFFGGSTIRIKCDNLKVGVTSHPREGDIILNEKYESLGDFYFAAIMPTGIRKPKHKASVEGTVGKIATAIIAKLRNMSFYSMDELKIAIRNELEKFNRSKFQKREGSRYEVFHEMEKQYLRALPPVPFEIAEWVYGYSVNLDCHISYKTNRYSAPYQYVGKKVNLKITDTFLEIYFKEERIATHRRIPDYLKHKWSTLEEHMPDYFHRTEWDDERIQKWAYTIGKNTGEVIDRIFASVRIKEQGYNAALSVLKLAKTYTDKRLETACEIALSKVRSPRYSHLKALLSSNQDTLHLARVAEQEKKELNKSVQGYVRGSDYYSGGDKS